LCAVAADAFRQGRTQQLGENGEGFVVVPVPSISNRWANVAHLPKTSAADVP